jgi:hypothetical protein
VQLLGAGSRTERVEACAQLALELIRTHTPETTSVADSSHQPD